MTEKQSFIYVLADPRDSIVRYVGSTIDVRRRAKDHQHRQSGQPKLAQWKNSLFDAGLKPKFTLIMICPRHRAKAYERMIIDRYRQLGNNLLNVR
ncbi:MAG: GIY-YIG nuclease family protein [Candidatus Competibacteraceae bacterium]|nr:GIY-YIG nuclease family protein [Candidatus Competibacteraceae bacterium]